jgi:opacity protein-like surface antigen
MRLKLVLAALIIFFTFPAVAQVAPSVTIGGLPLGVGAGLSDYSLDYGPGRRMIGISAWADYNIFHGLGIEVEGTSIFADKPDDLERMRQDTIKGGAVYKYHTVFRVVRPYAKGLAGIGSIDFPSHNPLYTHDTFTVFAIGGGAEVKAWRNLFVRGDYEYEFWEDYHGTRALNPNGFTIGGTYYLRGIHGHS